MNQREIAEEYDIPHFTYSDEFLEAFRKLRTVVGNKDRAYERLIKDGSETNRRARTQSKSAST